MIKKILKIIKQLKKEYETTNPFVICQYLGIHIEYSNIAVKGMYINSFGIKNIILNSNLSGFAKFFTLAHELWHAIEDNGEEVRFFKDYTFNNTDIFEIKANTFAAYMLLDDEKDCFNIENIDDLEEDIKKELEQFIQRILERNNIVF